jgi:hemerythrin-like domain-containing protein
MQATSVLRAEHDAVLVLLEQLERAGAAAERGAPVPGSVFLDIGTFFSVFVDRCHHGKEEAEIFPRLATAGRTELVQRLQAEHAAGRRLASAYADAARAYTPGDREAGARVAATARAYSAHLRQHIDEETVELLPALERTLAADDQELIAGFARIEKERIGPGTHERLHEVLEMLPDRIDPYGAAVPALR